MSDTNLLARLERWYASNCDGDWEHDHGVKIGNIDNPGWRFAADLTDTSLEAAAFEKVKVERTDDDWYHCFVESHTFEGAGGPHNLTDIIRVFVDWVEAAGQATSDREVSR